MLYPISNELDNFYKENRKLQRLRVLIYSPIDIIITGNTDYLKSDYAGINRFRERLCKGELIAIARRHPWIISKT